MAELTPTDPRTLVRTNDPGTSHEAAYKVDTTVLEGQVLAVIRAWGEDGVISDEIREIMQHRHGVTSYSSVTARYKALEEKGLIEYRGDKRKGKSGWGQRVIRPADQTDKHGNRRLI